MPAGTAPNTIVTCCKKCGTQLRAPAALAGKRGKCAQCGTAIQIPLKSERAPATAQPAAAEAQADEKPGRKSVNMPLVCMVAAVAGVALGVGIYALLPSSSIFLPPVPAVTKPDAAPASTAPAAASPIDNRNDPPVPSVINLAPKDTRPERRSPSESLPIAPTPPPPETGPRPSFGPGSNMGPDMGSDPGSGSGPGMRSGRGSGQGPDSGSGPGMRSGRGSGMGPGQAPSMRPGPGSGQRPDMRPGTGPGPERGMGSRPGPGTRPGPRPGTNPGPEPGTSPGPEQ